MFRFRLAGFKRLKEYKEKLCRDEVGRCVIRLGLAVEDENKTRDAVSTLEREISGALEGKIDVSRLMIDYNYLQYLKELLIKRQEVVFLRRRELEEARLRLFEAMKERKILDKLQEKKLQQYEYEKNRLEQALLDELARTRE